MTKPVWSHALALSALTLKKAHNGQLPGNLSLDYKYLHANQIPHQLSVPSQTIPDLPSINTLACSKAEI